MFFGMRGPGGSGPGSGNSQVETTFPLGSCPALKLARRADSVRNLLERGLFLVREALLP